MDRLKPMSKADLSVWLTEEIATCTRFNQSRILDICRDCKSQLRFDFPCMGQECRAINECRRAVELTKQQAGDAEGSG